MGICIAIKIAIVSVATAVTTSNHIDCPVTMTTGLYPLDQGSPSHGVWSIDRLSIIIRTPTETVNSYYYIFNANGHGWPCVLKHFSQIDDF
jgi:hypothetical protein